MVCGVKKETSYLHGAQHYAVVTLHKNAGVAATTPFTYSKTSTSTESLRRRGKNQQQLIFPSVLSPVACAPPLTLPLQLRSLRNQSPLPPQAPVAELSARVAVFILFSFCLKCRSWSRFRHGWPHGLRKDGDSPFFILRAPVLPHA